MSTIEKMSPVYKDFLYAGDIIFNEDSITGPMCCTGAMRSNGETGEADTPVALAPSLRPDCAGTGVDSGSFILFMDDVQIII